jgi:hypothetical protein
MPASATFAVNSELCFFRVFDTLRPRPTGRSKRTLSLNHLSSFRGPPHNTMDPFGNLADNRLTVYWGLHLMRPTPTQ